MISKYLLFLAVVIFKSYAVENDVYYVVNNGVISKNYVPSKPYSFQNFPLPLLKINSDQEELVKIQLYYECLCPDCRRFDNEEFKDTVLTLGSYLDINVYPYGNARTEERDGRVEFTCQHGPPECYGNKLHACAIDYFQNVTAAILYNSCMMDSSQAGEGSDDLAADVCARAIGIDSSPIKQCAKGIKGTALLKYYGTESKKANFHSVPHILINGVENSGNNFKQDVCKAIKNPPQACKELLY